MYPKSVLSKLKKNMTIFHLKIIVFTAVKYYTITDFNFGRHKDLST